MSDKVKVTGVVIDDQSFLLIQKTYISSSLQLIPLNPKMG